MPDETAPLENHLPSLPSYPELHEMQDYFNIRLTTDPQKPAGIERSKDVWGNRVYTSLNKSEDTMAGEQPATLITTEEGKDVILSNKGLLRQIQNGEIPFEGIEFNSMVYPIELNTPEGKKKFVLKYISYDQEEDYKAHTSGIQAMRLMQMASKEKPIQNLTYATPILATHDFTLAPFINDGLSLDQMLGYLNNKNDDRSRKNIEHAWSHIPEAVATLKLLREEYKTPVGEEFVDAIRDETTWVSKFFNNWIQKTIYENSQFKAYKLNSDLALSQYVIDMSKVFDLYNLFKSQPDEWRVGDGFSEELMKILGVVELAHGSEEDEI